MARTINKVELLGRVGTDPEMQYTPRTAVTKLRRTAIEMQYTEAEYVGTASTSPSCGWQRTATGAKRARTRRTGTTSWRGASRLRR